MIQTIALSKLRPSPRNVRKAGGVSIDDLAASIAVHGLLQNLSVEPAGDTFEVVAGGRRFAALSRLVEAGTLPADFPVPCRITDSAAAHEASLAENVIRQAMHPADEFDAFAKLAADGLTAVAIAERFGTTELHVRKRLKLANVAPELVAEYRAGKADLEQMMALALSDDHEAQRRAWAAGKRDDWKRSPRMLREALTTAELRVDTSLGKFVGAEAYEAAGGVIRRDLFGDDRDAYFTDPELLRRLAEEKLQRTADRLATREGWAWTEARVDFDWSERDRFGKAPSDWKGTKQVWSDEAKASAGAIATIGYNGQAEIYRGLVRPEDRKAAGPDVTGGKKPKDPAALPFAQVQRLQGVRTAVLRSELATQPRVALAALAADLGRRIVLQAGHYGADEPVVRIGADNYYAVAPMREGIEAATTPAFEQIAEHWRTRLRQHQADLFAWLLEEPESTTHELLAFVAASRIFAGDTTEQKVDRGQRFAHLAGLDMAEHWQVTEEWLAAQPKGYVLAAVAEACGKKTAERLTKLKKGELARRAAELIVDSEIGPGAKPRWLPKPLRAPKRKAAKTGVSA